MTDIDATSIERAVAKRRHFFLSNIQDLTMKMARRQIEKDLGLAPKHLDAAPFKTRIAELVDAVQTNDPDQVRQLLARATVSGINAPSPRHHGMTPLSLAANNGALHVAASATSRGLVWRPGCRCI